MLINKRQDYGILLMVMLAKNWGKRVSLSKVASFYHLSPLFLKQLASCLKAGRLIISREGAGGGYKLARNPRHINLAEILEVLSNGQLFKPACLRTGGSCPLSEGCPPKLVWQKINQEILKNLKAVSLAAIIK
jgi:Rrf2 family protein